MCATFLGAVSGYKFIHGSAARGVHVHGVQTTCAAARVRTNTYAEALIAGAPLMILLIKVSSMACGYGDSVRPEAELKRSQLARRIMTPPGLLEMLGFGFFPCGWLTGARACERACAPLERFIAGTQAQRMI